MSEAANNVAGLRAIVVLLFTLPFVTAGCDAIFGIQEHPLAPEAAASLDADTISDGGDEATDGGNEATDGGSEAGDATGTTDGVVPHCPICRMGSTMLGSCCVQ